jgi:hypothetical protein
LRHRGRGGNDAHGEQRQLENRNFHLGSLNILNNFSIRRMPYSGVDSIEKRE